jgi:hypothetical protein
MLGFGRCEPSRKQTQYPKRLAATGRRWRKRGWCGPARTVISGDMPEESYDRDFPNLKRLGFTRKSKPAYHNCAAFVVGDFKRRWWPGEYDPVWSDDYWPDTEPNDESLDAFVAGLAVADYVPCTDGDKEDGFEKVAIYAATGIVKHVAWQQEDGMWKSKLGPDEDIQHTLDGLAGPFYGQVIAYLRRPRTGAYEPRSFYARTEPK